MIRRKHRWMLPLAICLLQGAGAAMLFGQATLTTIRTSGPTSSYINLVYLSEGYTTAQLPQFLVDVTNTMNKLLTLPPWNAYSNFFNVFAISVASAESGSDHYTPTTILVDTYFNSSFDSYGIQRLLTIPPNNYDADYNDGYGKVDALLQQFVPEYDIVGLIVNDTAFGGSGGQYLLLSVNSSSGEIANHEIGHTFAGLGDEYSTPYPGYPDVEEPNTTTNATASVKWNAWILPTTLIPTPDVSSNYSVMGVFQGAHYHADGWYRPKHDCKMRSLGVPYCEVCAQELVLSMYRVTRPIQGFLPAAANVVIGSQSSAAFAVSLLTPAGGGLTVQWFTNNVAFTSATGTNVSIGAAQLAAGTNEIKVVVHDPTSYARVGSTGVLWDTNLWNVTVVPAPTLINPVLTGTTFTSSAQTTLGFKYVLEYKNLLTAPNWTPVQTSDGTGGLVNFTDTGLTVPSRFYHLRVQ